MSEKAGNGATAARQYRALSLGMFLWWENQQSVGSPLSTSCKEGWMMVGHRLPIAERELPLQEKVAYHADEVCVRSKARREKADRECRIFCVAWKR